MKEQNTTGFNLLSASRGSKVLTKKEFRDLHFKWRFDDCEKSRDELIKCNILLVLKLARARERQQEKVDYDDLVQAGMEGLGVALEKFEPAMDYMFSTYATWWIKEFINREIRSNSSTIRVPSHMYKEMQKYSYVLKSLPPEKQTAQDVYDKLKAEGYNPSTIVVTVARIQKAIDLLEVSSVHSLDAKINSSSEGDDSKDLISSYLAPDEDPEYSSVEYDLHAYEMKALVSEIIQTHLNENEKNVLIRRFGVLGSDKLTLEATGREIGVTRERVRQIQTTAMKKLKFNLKKRGFYE